MGFTIFSTKVDKRLLIQIAVGMVGCCSTVLTWKATLAEEFIVAEEEEEVCAMAADQLDFIRSAASFINATCTYTLKVGPGGASPLVGR